jgi:hypothetical protein
MITKEQLVKRRLKGSSTYGYQGDQIWRILAHWVIVYHFAQCVEKLRFVLKILGYTFPRLRSNIIFDTKWVRLHFGRLFY